MNLIIEFTLPGGVTRYAQNPSETFDGAFTVVRKSEAKQFETYREAHEFLARFKFMRRRRSRASGTGFYLGQMQAPFTGWEILRVGETPESRAFTRALANYVPGETPSL